MLAYAVTGAFGLENLKRVERPQPTLGANDVLLRVHAASLNYRDLLMVKGTYNPRQPLPLVPLSDGAGEIVAVGPDVTRVHVGDHVTTLFSQKHHGGKPTRASISANLGGPIDGALQEYMALPETGVIPMPSHLSFEEGATLPCAGVTAWNAIAVHGELTPGDTLLTIGTGGVSVFALQIAKLFGLRVIITSRSPEKLARALELGADHGVATGTDWWRDVRKLAPEGVDHVIEVGGMGTLEQSIRAVRPGGQISLIGVLAGSEKPLNLTPVLMQNIRIQGVFVGNSGAALGLTRALEAHMMKPVIDRVYPVDRVHDAFAAMEGGQHFGKIVIKF